MSEVIRYQNVPTSYEHTIVIEIAPKFDSLRNGPLFDTVLEIPGVKRYSAHKAILALSSEYFKIVFAGRFGQSSTIVLSQVEPQIVDLYLDMIYGKTIILDEWRETMKLFIFAKFTQTKIPNHDNIITGIKISPEEFVEYIQNLSTLYDNDIPMDILRLIDMYPIIFGIDANEVYGTQRIKFSDLGEDFVRALIESQFNNELKTFIAYGAIKDGMSMDLYGLVQMEKLSLIIEESIPYLRKFDTSRLTDTNYVDNDNLVDTGSLKLLIGDFMGEFMGDAKVPYVVFTGTDRNGTVRLLSIPIRKINDRLMMTISSDGTEENLDKILHGVAIDIKKFHKNLNNAIISEGYGYKGYGYRGYGHEGYGYDYIPIVIDKYEIFY